MLVKGTLDFIRQFMLKNHIEYLDENGWNEVFYNELSEDERGLVMDLTPLYTYLHGYIEEPIIKKIEREGKIVNYVNHFGIDMETGELFVVIQFENSEREIIKF